MNKYDFEIHTTHTNRLDPIEEANKRYAEKLKVQRTIAAYDSRKLELLMELDGQPELALKACGFDFIKTVCSIDQELAHNFLSILSQAVENDNFEDVDLNFRKIIFQKLEEEEKNSKKYR